MPGAGRNITSASPGGGGGTGDELDDDRAFCRNQLTNKAQAGINIRTGNEYPISAHQYPRLGTPTSLPSLPVVSCVFLFPMCFLQGRAEKGIEKRNPQTH
jgi:hypothetical protein